MPIENSKERRGDGHGGEAKDGGAALEKPPVLAPLSFFGLGLLGMIACASRFQPSDEITITDTRAV